jgi:uncharacterized protein (TIGR02271 family)
MTEFDVRSLTGATVVDRSGDRIGEVVEVYLDDVTGQPQWVTVRTGLFGRRESFVPLAAARVEGDQVRVDATKEQVGGAPQAGEDGRLSPRDEAEIYRYYGLAARPADPDPAGPDPDGAMIRSEEHLVAAAPEVRATRVRLRKYVVTEMVTVQVPVRREEIRLEHEPITDVEREAAYAGGSVTDITEVTGADDDTEQEIILHAERPVVTTETVAVERIRLGKETVTGTETVTGEVRRERIELDDPTDPSR